jgi:hypothetical protein
MLTWFSICGCGCSLNILCSQTPTQYNLGAVARYYFEAGDLFAFLEQSSYQKYIPAIIDLTGGGRDAHRVRVSSGFWQIEKG